MAFPVWGDRPPAYDNIFVEETAAERLSAASKGAAIMSNAVAKVIELTASSSTSIEAAVENGIRRADATLDDVAGAWIQDIKCIVKNGKVAAWRVHTHITFLLND